MHPFKEKTIKGKLIREFKSSVNSKDLVWHRDREDRDVIVHKGTGWRLQIDNMLPVPMIEGRTYRIPKNTYHRVIKGNSSLVVEIKKYSNKVKITRNQIRMIVEAEINGSARPGELGISTDTGGESSTRQDIEDEIENTTAQINSMSSSTQDQQQKKVLQDKLRMLQRQNSSM